MFAIYIHIYIYGWFGWRASVYCVTEERAERACGTIPFSACIAQRARAYGCLRHDGNDVNTRVHRDLLAEQRRARDEIRQHERTRVTHARTPEVEAFSRRCCCRRRLRQQHHHQRCRRSIVLGTGSSMRSTERACAFCGLTHASAT